MELVEVAERLERITGLVMSDLYSKKRGSVLPDARINLTALAVGRFGNRGCDVAKLLQKNPGTVSLWLTTAD